MRRPAMLYVWAELDWETGGTAWRWEIRVAGKFTVRTVRSHKHAAGARRSAKSVARRHDFTLTVEAVRETPLDKRPAAKAANH
jgi:hypothetical protein